MEAFCNQEFHVLCATESYEVGIHNPHIEYVTRVGCLPNIGVLLQEFGRAGHVENCSSDGLLLFNENKDDKRLGYWIKGCSEADTKRIKEDYASCWQWIYCIYTGDCLRQAMLQYYSEGNYTISILFKFLYNIQHYLFKRKYLYTFMVSCRNDGQTRTVLCVLRKQDMQGL